MRLRLLKLFDARGTRAIIAFVLAVALWSVFIDCFVDGLSESPEPVRPLTLDARLVEITPAPPPPARPAPAAPPAAARSVSHVAAAARPTHVVRPMVRQPAPAPSPLPARSATPAPAPVAAPSATTENRPGTAETAATSSSSTGPSTGASSGASGNASAHPILRPLPVLPDDLREFAYQAVALARFTIHPDGSVDVALVRPTQNPRLNQLLLETLRNWRFFPAMKDGHPVESEQDIRVHFNVG
ncbi:energy transducer TonB [Caballeronia sp. DA-9]|uniref:energy transducer TonB n=1 Tax=Caballeronia sp. DA-9 TaxID=3436237 RepID=UPI003F675E35